MTKKTFKNLTWYHIEEPHTEKTISFLKKKFKFHKLDLEDCLSENERPKIDEYKDYLFIILHFPVYNKKTRRVGTSELKMFVGQNYVVSLYDKDLTPMQNFFNSCSKKAVKEEVMGQGSGYLLYKIIQACYDYCLPITDKSSRNIRLIEKNLFDDDYGNQNILNEILIVKRNVINLTRILSPQASILIKLEMKNKKFLTDSLEVYFDDIKDTSDKLRDNLILNREVIDALQSTHESLISYRTNKVMKMLTVFSVIMLPLTFLTGLWGMNVHLPFADDPEAFWFIAVIMIIIMTGMLSFFKSKKWL